VVVAVGENERKRLERGAQALPLTRRAHAREELLIHDAEERDRLVLDDERAKQLGGVVRHRARRTAERAGPNARVDDDH
jgi:hypothetical protein